MNQTRSNVGWLLGGSAAILAVALLKRFAMPSVRTKLLQIAVNEEGSADPLKYWQGVTTPQMATEAVSRKLAWCGVFALWALKQAGIVPGTTSWVFGKGFVGPLGLPATKTPQPGDIAYIDQPYQHHALVISVNEDGSVTTVDGNQPTVQIRKRPRGSFTAFYSIEPLLKR